MDYQQDYESIDVQSNSSRLEWMHHSNDPAIFQNVLRFVLATLFAVILSKLFKFLVSRAYQMGELNATGTNLQQLNEDCLLEIFSVKSLDPMDLCSLAETCKRFRQITQRIAPKMNFEISCSSKRKNFKRFLENFGSNLSTVDIRGNYPKENFLMNLITEYRDPLDSKQNFLLQLTTEHCNEGKLKNVLICTIQIPHVHAVKLRPIFKRLQTLYLSEVSITHDGTLFAELDSLVALSVDRVTNCGAILENTFPKLERFEYLKEEIVMDSSIAVSSKQQTFGTLRTFISSHKTLKTLFLFGLRCDYSCRTVIPQFIANNCEALVSLGLCLGAETVSKHILRPLQTLTSLRTLHLSCVSFLDLELFSKLTELRELALSYCELPDDSEQFAHLTQLNTLELRFLDNYDTIDAVGIIARLTNLEVLKYWSNLDEETISQIVSVVRGRPIVLKLKCLFRFNVENYSGDTQNVRLIQNLKEAASESIKQSPKKVAKSVQGPIYSDCADHWMTGTK